MKRIHEVTAEEENWRSVPFVGTHFVTSKVDFVKPEPEGIIILLPFRIVGYDQDCDGSAMARLESIDINGDETGWEVDHIGLFGGGLVVTLEELRDLATVKE